jgi:hypothetical protein
MDKDFLHGGAVCDRVAIKQDWGGRRSVEGADRFAIRIDGWVKGLNKLGGR